MTQQKPVGRAIAALGLCAIALATLTPMPLNESRVTETPFWCLVCGQLGLIDVILNVALFVPLGVGLRWLGWPLIRIAIASFLVSVAVESLQIVTIAGRDGSVSDLITNTAGGGLGGFLFSRWRTLAFPTPRNAGQLLVAGELAVLAVFLSTAALLQPDLPTGPWYGIVAPTWPGYGVFGGTVLDARVGQRPLSRDTLPREGEYRTVLLSGAPILVRFVVGERTPIGLGPITALMSPDRQSLALLTQRGRDLIFGVRLRASAWRLRSPRIRLTRAMPESPGDTVVAWGGIDSGGLYAGAIVKERWQSRRLALSIALGWALLLPIGWGLGPEAQVLNSLWLGVLLVPLAYWAILSRQRSALLWVGLLALLALGFLPPAFGLGVGHWSEWSASVGAIVLGTMAATHVRTRPARSR